jgi:hypothetical protein
VPAVIFTKPRVPELISPERQIKQLSAGGAAKNQSNNIYRKNIFLDHALDMTRQRFASTFTGTRISFCTASNSPIQTIIGQ